MPTVWTKNPDGVWVAGQPAVKAATGWLNGKIIYEKTNSTTWTVRWSKDLTPPAAPALTLTGGTTTTPITVRVTAPSASDTTLVRVKVQTSGFPATTAVDGAYYPVQDGTGEAWSDWKVTPSQVRTKSFYPPQMVPLPKLVAGVTYYFTAWAQDSSFNWSAPATASFKVPVPTPPPPTTVHKTGYVTTTDSGSYSATFDNWRTDSNYVYQAGAQDMRGLWFYSTKIQSTLAKAKSITKMQIYVQRVNSVHGVSGASHVRLVASSMASQPAGDPISHITGSSYVGDLNRGEGAWFNVPSSWWPSFISGAYKGFGLRYTTTSYTDVNYMYAYGAGTNSGKVYIEWTE